MKIRAHEVPPGSNQCMHCGAYNPTEAFDENTGLKICTCNEREISIGMEIRPEPKSRIMACDDSDIISKRIKELEQEKQTAWNTPAT